jgi:hypothetical protein
MVITTLLTSGFNGEPYWDWQLSRMLELQDGSPMSLLVQAALVEYGLMGVSYTLEKMSPTSTKVVLTDIQQIIFIKFDYE